MRFKQDYVSSQFHQLYFEISAEEINDIFDSVSMEATKSVNEDKLIKMVKDKIEYEVLEFKIAELDVYKVGPKVVTYLTEIGMDKSLLGIAKFCIIPEDLSFSLPPYIPISYLKNEVTPKEVKDVVDKVLVQNGYYTLEDTTDYSVNNIYTYDLCYVSKNVVLNTIKNQTFEPLDYTSEISYLLFKNKQVNDVVILDEDVVTAEARITKIEKKVPVALTDEIVKKLNFSTATTVEEFNKKIKETKLFGKILTSIVFYMTEFIFENGEIEFDSYVEDFYALYAKKSSLITDEIDYDSGIKRMMVIEYFNAMIDSRYDFESTKYIDRLDDELRLAELLEEDKTYYDTEHCARRLEELKILNYCVDEKIIDIKI